MKKKNLTIGGILLVMLLIAGCTFAPKTDNNGETKTPDINQENPGSMTDDSTNNKTEPKELPPSSLSNVNAKKLTLSNSNLKSLPSEIGNLTKVEEFYVDHNALTGALPGEIRKMTNLRILDASNNSLTGIPAEIGQLKNLEELNFSNNMIDTMPNEIYNLKDNLKVLNLSGNPYMQEKIDEIRAGLPKTNVIF